MAYAKALNQIQKIRPRLLVIGPKTSFGKIFKKIKSSKNTDFVWVRKARTAQMAAVLTSRLIGRKFFWIQTFTNPPSANFLTRLLLSQADRIVVTSWHIARKLKDLGIDKAKIKIQARTSGAI